MVYFKFTDNFQGNIGIILQEFAYCSKTNRKIKVDYWHFYYVSYHAWIAWLPIIYLRMSGSEPFFIQSIWNNGNFSTRMQNLYRRRQRTSASSNEIKLPQGRAVLRNHLSHRCSDIRPHKTAGESRQYQMGDHRNCHPVFDIGVCISQSYNTPRVPLVDA